MLKIRKFLSIVIIIAMFMVPNNLVAFADANTNDYFMQYNGSTTASYGYRPNCTFTIYKMVNGRFKGNFTATNLGSYDVNQNVEGNVYDNYDSFTCVFSFTNYYNTTFIIDVYPYEGYCECITSGSWHFEDFLMYGTRFQKPEGTISIADDNNYNNNDMLLCMHLSNDIYGYKSPYVDKNGKEKEEEFTVSYSESFKNILKDKEGNSFFTSNNISEDTLKVYNFKSFGTINDHKKDNVAFSIMLRNNNDGNADMIVVIRGTYKDEWQGNTELTGTEYSDISVHNNFQKACDSIKPTIKKYYSKYCDEFESINLIITGHSRGAAVANLYAKEATDAKIMNYTTEIPTFSAVTAYTFACPNVAKYTENAGMENYSNIYNFNFQEDLIPTVPLTKPTNGWDYWKYGKTYVAQLKDENYETNNLYSKEKLKSLAVHKIHDDFWYWPSVYDYYNKRLYKNGESSGDYTTIYEFAHSATGLLGSLYKKVKGGLNLVNNFKRYNKLVPIIEHGIYYKDSISTAHHYDTYLAYIKYHSDEIFDVFNYVSYNSIKNGTSYLKSKKQIVSNSIYNNYESSKLCSFYNQINNSTLLDWDTTDQSTWTGITWNSSGNVTAIELPYLDLEGTLDLSDFSSLESVNIAGNKLTSIDLTDCDSLINLNVSSNNLTSLDVSDCTELETLDCSFNDLSTDGLDVSANTALTTLTCDDCGLTTLNVSTLTALEELSCAFNELTTINIDSNTALTSLICCYNYMDTHEGGTLYNKFDDLLFSDVYVNYYPQAIPDNATFNTSELNALKTFALTENNNAALDWLDENDNVDTDKLQNNVLFEYDGSKYRVVAVDIADTEVEGALNLTALTKLKELYCENTSITSLNVNGCTALNTLSCDNCEITSLTLPSNAAAKNTPLYDVSCEYNYIDTSIFTDTMVDYITFKAGATLEYGNQKGDNSALVAVMEFSDTLSSNDYSESSFNIFSEIIEDYEDYEYLLLTQTDIDEVVTEILTSINSLEPYLDLDISAPHGAFTVTYDNELQNGNTHSLLFGTPVTLTATADEGYVFDGWYEKVTQRKFSSNSTYTFKITTNMDLEARFVRTGDVTLTFTNDTGQVVAKIDKSISEWSEVTGISDLLPEVPYKLGHTNGRWNYTEADVLTALQVGNDVTITPIYDDSTYEYPTVPTPADNVPLLNLYYSLDFDNNVGSFTMAAGIPQDLNIEAIGIGFYYKKAASFNPSNFILNINNKMLTSRFDNTDSDGIYIVNINKFTSAYNWCARGYITFYDENNELKTVYSNQINIVDREQIA